jgi:uncharacterized protein YciI
MALFVTLRAAGPAWVAGVGVREQPLWDEHAVFMDRLFDEGRILLGGPFTDGAGAMVIVEINTDDPADVRAMFAADPWITDGIHVLTDVKPWQIFLDARVS